MPGVSVRRYWRDALAGEGTRGQDWGWRSDAGFRVHVDVVEQCGDPPAAALYITKETDSCRLPSMELERLIYEDGAYRRYLEGAPGG